MYLYGVSGYVKVIIDILWVGYELIEVLFDDNVEVIFFFGYFVLCLLEVWGLLIVSIGNNWIWKRIVDILFVEFGCVIYFLFIVFEFVDIGEGSVVM